MRPSPRAHTDVDQRLHPLRGASELPLPSNQQAAKSPTSARLIAWCPGRERPCGPYYHRPVPLSMRWRAIVTTGAIAEHIVSGRPKRMTLDSEWRSMARPHQGPFAAASESSRPMGRPTRLLRPGAGPGQSAIAKVSEPHWPVRALLQVRSVPVRIAHPSIGCRQGQHSDPVLGPPRESRHPHTPHRTISRPVSDQISLSRQQGACPAGTVLVECSAAVHIRDVKKWPLSSTRSSDRSQCIPTFRLRQVWQHERRVRPVHGARGSPLTAREPRMRPRHGCQRRERIQGRGRSGTPTRRSLAPERSPP